MQSVFSYFIRTFGAVLMFTVFFGNAVFADTCEPGKYMAFAMESSAYGDRCEHECEPCNCADGQTCDGTGWYNYDCPTMEFGGDKGCRVPADLCLGYNDCPEDVGGSGKKCKEVSGCPNGCHKYEICDTTTGAITNEVTPTDTADGCHMEGNTCYANTVPCSTFDIGHWAVWWNCDQGAQIGMAEWKTNTWDTKNCTCSVVDRNLVSYDGGVSAEHNCIKANADFYVPDANRYLTTSVTGSVYYAFLRQFCRQCAPGYLPTIINSPSSGVSYRPESTSGNWGTYECKTPVRAPNYADGCVIDWTKSTGNAAINACEKSCDAGMIIDEDGATGPDWCEVDPSQRFTDNTGMFIIGEGQCSTPGGGGG